MKKTIFYSIMALAIFTTTSCGDDFLQIEPVGAVGETTLMTADGVDYVLTGAYSTLNNMIQTHWMGAASLSNYVFGDVAGADANKGSQSSDQSDFTQIETYSFTSENSYISGKWGAVYESVKRCNNVLDMVSKAGDGVLKNADQIAAQAKFIKGVWMFEGIRMFGAAIPYVSLEDYQANTDPQVSNVDEGKNYIYIWDKVAQDLKDAAAGLPATWGAGNYGRATSWMAKAVLAKLYLYWSSPYNGTNATADHWADAKALLKDIIDNGVDAKGQKYKLADNYGELFDAETADWTGESVFDVQLTINGTEVDTNTISYAYAIGQPGASGLGGWGFYQPTFEFVNSFITDENGLPDPNYTKKERLTIMGNINPVSDLSTPTDPRLDYAAGRFGVPFYDYGVPVGLSGWIRDYTNGGLYMNKKNLPKIADRGSTSVSTTVASSAKNYHVIRFADIMLMYAECCIHEGDLETAREMINTVRARAANSSLIANDFVATYAKSGVDVPTDYTMDDKADGKIIKGTVANYRIGLYKTPFANAAEATTALQREMRAEFGMEGHRWFDLARWGIVADVLNAYRGFEGKFFPGKFSAAYNANWVTFPIPLNEIQTSEGRFVQNVNWGGEGK
ncbi:MAG: RagB/SusD family nutrient uptake outer membrane protein [Phocaeicola sp.]|uniref:RagB/SusD family nutrient uptake outer membrane protein n=1 Tax=Phocaeicola sp. TaxID=2773926 RepID=UPI003FA196EA